MRCYPSSNQTFFSSDLVMIWKTVDFPAVTVESGNDSIKKRRRFMAGAVFSAKVFSGQCTQIHVPAGVSLTITTAIYSSSEGDVSATLENITRDGFDDDSRDFAASLCYFPERSTISGLGLCWVGPQEVDLSARGGDIHIVGSVQPASFEYRPTCRPAEETTTTTQQIRENESLSTTPSHHARPPKDKECGAASKKRKLSDAEHVQQGTAFPVATEEAANERCDEDDKPAESKADEEQAPQLSNKQRRNLAKKKAKELAEAVAFLNKHENIAALSTEANNGSKKVSLTKERRLPSGILIKDLIIGSGSTVKLGRKVSILYEGRFSSGKVFDKKRNRNSPLTFRQGTGEVVKGLEKGIEGMKVGGEREITIPPNMGYGKKGSGDKIPPNSTLVFSVQVVGLG